MDYKPRDIEKKWKKYWEDNAIYKIDNTSDKPKYYVLDMFPYPSGAGLHVGHPLGYIASDIFARYKRLKGFHVLHPMGYDAFGLPAEQYAIQTGVHPAVSTDKNIARYREQLENLGFSFDWSREVRTSDPSYYKWTQWIFLQLFEHWYDTEQEMARPISDLTTIFESAGNAGVHAATTQDENFSAAEWKKMSAKEQDDVLMNYRLAYRKTTYVNWCEALGTVLANDEVKDGVSERGGFPVERKPMLQWSLRITAYAERLLNDLQDLEWSDAMKKMQSNWIGRSEGATMFFDIENFGEKLEIYTTRPDTIFGVDFMVLAPEHPFVEKITTDEQRSYVHDYLDYVKARSERERMAETKEITGAFTGAFAVHPFTKRPIPIWISEYVLMDYGTGAIMAVPCGDQRDFNFARHFNIPITNIIGDAYTGEEANPTKEAILENSDFLNGMVMKDAIGAAVAKIQEMGIGERRINYRLRDAIYSRQRYWGEPFPVVYDKEGVAHPMSEDELPLELPPLDNFKPASGAKSPLARAEDWVNLHNGWTRETDTMPGFAGSSWYFLRYMDPGNEEEFASQDAVNYWQDVDLYVGGTEHAVGHLMYSRFWHKFLYDKKLVPTKEPFKKLVNQGMIQGVAEMLYWGDSGTNTFFVPTSKNTEGTGFPNWQLNPPIGKKYINVFYSSDISDHVPGDARGSELRKRIPIKFVRDYDLNTPSYLDESGIKELTDWDKSLSEAVFVTKGGFWHEGRFTKTVQDLTDSNEIKRFYTISQIGKMSKSWYNVINPDDVVEEYGADTFRMYEMFLGPIEQAKPWDTQGIGGVSRFLRRFWELFFDEKGNFHITDEDASKEELKIVHATIKKVSEDIERFSFNTCVSTFMEATNDLRKLKCDKRMALQPLVVLLAPFAPHITEELWHLLGNEGSVHQAHYPVYEERFLKEDSIEYPVSINGKKRALAEFPADASKEDLEKAALEVEDIQKWIEGKTIRKIIVVPKRMINIVVG